MVLNIKCKFQRTMNIYIFLLRKKMLINTKKKKKKKNNEEINHGHEK